MIDFDAWHIRVVRLGGSWRPWHAFITHGIMNVGEPGFTTFASRTPDAAARKALRRIARNVGNGRDATVCVSVREGPR